MFSRFQVVSARFSHYQGVCSCPRSLYDFFCGCVYVFLFIHSFCDLFVVVFTYSFARFALAFNSFCSFNTGFPLTRFLVAKSSYVRVNSACIRIHSFTIVITYSFCNFSSIRAYSLQSPSSIVLYYNLIT